MKTARVVQAFLCLLVVHGLFLPGRAHPQTVPINSNVVITGHVNACVATGAANTYACSLDYPLLAYNPRACYRFTANAANTGAATLNLNTLGAKTLKKVQGGITTDLVANDIRTGQIVEVCYDGTNMQCQSCDGNAPSGAPGGSSGQAQYNNSSVLGGTTGLVVDGTTILSTKERVTTKSATATLGSGDGPVVACDTSAGAVVLTLPAASGSQGHWTIVKTTADANSCSVQRGGSDLLNGATGAIAATAQWSRIDLDAASTTTWSSTLGFIGGTGVATFLATPSSANLLAALTDETGTGLACFNNTPTLLTPTIASFVNAGHTHTTAAGGGTLAEAALALADLTTNNASTSAHGFMQKYPGGTSTFLRADGTFATPAGGGNVSNTGTPTSGQAAEWTAATVLQGVAVTGTGSYVKGTAPTIANAFLSTINAQTGTTYTVVAADNQKLVTFSNAAPIAVTLPIASTAGFTAGAVFHFRNLGVGTVTITPTTSTIDGTSPLTLRTDASVDLYSDGTNYSTQRMFHNPMTTAGDLLYGGTNGAATRLAAGTGYLYANGASAPTLAKLARGLVFEIGDPAGAALTVAATTTAYVTVPFACTLSAYNLLIDAGTLTVKFWKIATGTAIPTAANSINTSGVGIASGTALHSATMTDFTSTAVAKDDILAMNVTAVATAKYVSATLQCDQ